MSSFESFKLVETEHPDSSLYTDPDRGEGAFDAEGGLVYEKWESPRYLIEFRAEPFMLDIPFVVECTPVGTPFDIEAHPVRAESDGRGGISVRFHGATPPFRAQGAGRRACQPGNRRNMRG